MSQRKRSRSPLYVEQLEEDFEDDDYSHGSRIQQSQNAPPIQRNAANARERARMRVLSSAFCRLKTKLPWVPADTKLSKLDTLRLATVYIQQLRSSLATDGNSDDLYQWGIGVSRLSNITPANINSQTTSLVWPFSFHQHQQPHQESPPPPPPQHLSTYTNSNRSTVSINRWLAQDQTIHNSSDATNYSLNQSSSMRNEYNNTTTNVIKKIATNNNNNSTTAHG